MKMSKKSFLSKILICMLALAMLLTACGNSGDNPGNSDPAGNQTQSGGEDPNPPAANAKTTRFEAEYATITGSVPGFVGVFFGASNDCWLEIATGASNGYVIANGYIEGNEDAIPTITFTIVSDVEAEATIALGVGPSWMFDESFNTVYLDTNAGNAYPLTFNGAALSSSDVIKGEGIEAVRNDDGDVVKQGSDIMVANYGTVTLKAGENTFTIVGTTDSRCIDYLEITTTANVTMEEDHTNTYRVYSEDDFEYVERTV